MRNIFSSVHHKLFALSIALLGVGYVLLAQGPVDNPLSITVAPLIIVGVYCVLIPVALLVKEKQPVKSDKKSGV